MECNPILFEFEHHQYQVTLATDHDESDHMCITVVSLSERKLLEQIRVESVAQVVSVLRKIDMKIKNSKIVE